MISIMSKVKFSNWSWSVNSILHILVSTSNIPSEIGYFILSNNNTVFQKQLVSNIARITWNTIIITPFEKY